MGANHAILIKFKINFKNKSKFLAFVINYISLLIKALKGPYGY